MKTLPSLGTILAGLLAACLAPSASAVLVDRFYRLGDEAAEGAVNGAAVNATNGTFDSAGITFGQDEFVDLFPGPASPTYTSVVGRPASGTGRGLSFNGAAQQYVRGRRLGLPSTSVTSLTPNNYDFTGVSNRGLQLWARPSASTPGTAQTLIADTNQHGVRINATGAYAMRYAGADYASTVTATPNVWKHVMVVRGAGGASAMYIDGVAVALATGGYDGEDTADLVLGADTAGDEMSFTGGQSGFYSGLLDDVELFVIGAVRGPNPSNGNVVENFTATFSLGRDNDFAASVLSGVPGDLDQDGDLDASDRSAFVAGWLSEKRIANRRVGDVTTIRNGDLNFDGVTDIADLAAFQAAITGAGLAAITAGELVAVPEPVAMLTALAGLALASPKRRR
ncbi:MAG: LamG-like jellyroll fold domain-containing protein [Lacipirellulaceae bacterium]